MSRFTGPFHHCLQLSILALHVRRVLLVFPAKVVSTRKIADQSHDKRVFIAIAWLTYPGNVTAWHLKQSEDEFYKEKACVLTALEHNIVHLNALAAHHSPFAITRQQLDAKQQTTVEWC